MKGQPGLIPNRHITDVLGRLLTKQVELYLILSDLDCMTSYFICN